LYGRRILEKHDFRKEALTRLAVPVNSNPDFHKDDTACGGSIDTLMRPIYNSLVHGTV